MIRKPFRYQFFNATIVLIAANILIYLLANMNEELYNILTLIPRGSKFHSTYGEIWQIFTYMFMHAQQPNINHILFNMLGLFFFGSVLEKRLGSKEFLLYYLLTGLLTGILIYFFSPDPTLGASGALFAVLIAYACSFPDTRILLMFVIPVKATIAVLIFIVITIGSMIFSLGGNISHLGHLGGIIFGFLYLRLRLNIDPIRVFLNK